MLLLLVLTMHIKNISMNFVQMRRESHRNVVSILLQILVLKSTQDLTLLDQQAMIVIDVLCHEHALYAVLCAMFLELQDGVVALVWFALFLKFIKVVVPFPDSLRVLLEEIFC